MTKDSYHFYSVVLKNLQNVLKQGIQNQAFSPQADGKSLPSIISA